MLIEDIEILELFELIICQQAAGKTDWSRSAMADAMAQGNGEEQALTTLKTLTGGGNNTILEQLAQHYTENGEVVLGDIAERLSQALETFESSAVKAKSASRVPDFVYPVV